MSTESAVAIFFFAVGVLVGFYLGLKRSERAEKEHVKGVAEMATLFKRSKNDHEAQLKEHVNRCFMDEEGIPDRNALVRFIGGDFNSWAPVEEIPFAVTAYKFKHILNITLRVPEGMQLEAQERITFEDRMRKILKPLEIIDGPAIANFSEVDPWPILRCTRKKSAVLNTN